MKYLASIVAAAVLTACGGGGGGGGGVASTPAPVVATATLSSSNQHVAAQDTSSSAYMPVLGAQTLTGAQTSDESLLFTLARQQMDKLPTYVADAHANASLAGVVQSQAVACSSGGSLGVTVNDADNSGTATAGDTITIAAYNCVEAGTVINGTLGFAISTMSGVFNSNSYAAGMTMTFGNFTATSSALTASMNGSLGILVNTTGTYSSSVTIATSSLTMSATYAGVTRSRTLSNYQVSYVRAPSAYTYDTRYTISGSLTSSALSSQTVTFATASPIVTHYTDYYPSSGVLVISGANNTKVRVTALSNTQVTEELDANGDGTYETSTTVAWNTLM